MKILSAEFQRKYRARANYIGKVIYAEKWFPHLPVSLMMFLVGSLILNRYFGNLIVGHTPERIVDDIMARPALFPSLLIGGGLVIISFGLIYRSRVAWVMASILLFLGLINTFYFGHFNFLFIEFVTFSFVILLITWRKFDQTSIAAATLFALASVVMALTYATFGSFYLGAEFKPPITDLVTGLYYSMVTMSTVGYGDIVPQTSEAKLFVVSIIILGIVTFATSLTAVIGPLVSGSLHRIITRGGRKMKRENHFVVIGSTPLALNVWRELDKRGQAVTRIVRHPLPDTDAANADVVVGEPSNVEVLREAGADRAEAVLAMLDDDGENAFVILALKELGGKARSIAAINNAANEQRIRLVQPDMTIALQVFGGELLAMVLAGETVTSDFVMKRILHEHKPTEEKTVAETPPQA